MTCAPFILAPVAKALAETGFEGSPKPGKMTDAVGVGCGVGVGSDGVGVVEVSTVGFSST